MRVFLLLAVLVAGLSQAGEPVVLKTKGDQAEVTITISVADLKKAINEIRLKNNNTLPADVEQRLSTAIVQRALEQLTRSYNVMQKSDQDIDKEIAAEKAKIDAAGIAAKQGRPKLKLED